MPELSFARTYYQFPFIEYVYKYVYVILKIHKRPLIFAASTLSMLAYEYSMPSSSLYRVAKLEFRFP